MDHDHNNEESNRNEQFLKLLRQNEKKIYGYILAALPNQAIAEDIMQETIVVMWRKFSKYKSGTKFSTWGIVIARFLILEYLKKKRQSIIQFSPEAIENIKEVYEDSDNSGDRVEALRKCIEKMPEAEKKIIKLRYMSGDNPTIKQVAQKMGKPIQGMYKHMSKLHYILQECVENTLAAWEMHR